MSSSHTAFFKMSSARSQVRILQVLADKGEISVDEVLPLGLPAPKPHRRWWPFARIRAPEVSRITTELS